MHITLTGNLGSGKSTICKILAAKNNYEIYSTGKIQRELAAERGLTVLEMNKLMQTDPSFDHIIDDKVTAISIERKDDIVFDSRLAWHFAVDTFKVFVSVSINEAARRVFNDNRGDVETYSSVEDAKRQLTDRANTENVRYHDLYNLDYFRLSNYNLVIDSTYSGPEIITETILAEKKKYEELVAAGKKPSAPRILLSPSRLLGVDANSEDNLCILESNATIKMGTEDFEIVSGLDQVKEAVIGAYEFIAVNEA